MQYECQIEDECLDWLNANGWFAFKFKDYPYTPGKSRRPSKHQISGVADSFAIHPTHGSIWIEFKRPGGKLSEDQNRFRIDLTTQGGTYIVLTSIIDCRAFFVNLGACVESDEDRLDEFLFF